MELSIPFVDFYRTNNISPVGQDVSNLQRHFERRQSLYRSLGIPDLFVQNRSVVEFCPGSGFNALYTMSLEPRAFLLVDANATGLDNARDLFRAHFPSARGSRFVESLIENFVSDDKFDLVLCEGAVPWQHDPPAFARRIASFVCRRGLLVVTTIDPASFLSEIARRLVAAKVSSPNRSVAQRLIDLRQIFAIDLATLHFRSRPVDDWILDNIIQPLQGRRNFSLAEAISSIGQLGFDVYGVSPRFLRDWRWYKELVGTECRLNAYAIERYYRNILNLLDYRFEHREHQPSFGRAILHASERAWDFALAADRGDVGAIAGGANAILDVVALIEPHATETALGFAAVAHFLRAELRDDTKLAVFQPLFGRGQQYVSFIRS